MEDLASRVKRITYRIYILKQEARRYRDREAEKPKPHNT